MIDSKLKGTGNSRFLKSVADFKSKYPTYDAFVEALVAGTLPIDLNGINPDGWTQQGTPLNKATLLSDSTAAKLNLSGDATVDSALGALTNRRGASNGVASLNNLGKVPTSQLPDMNYIPTSQKGSANGVADLNSHRAIDTKNFVPSDNTLVSVLSPLDANVFKNEVSSAVLGNVVLICHVVYAEKLSRDMLQLKISYGTSQWKLKNTSAQLPVMYGPSGGIQNTAGVTSVSVRDGAFEISIPVKTPDSWFTLITVLPIEYK